MWADIALSPVDDASWFRGFSDILSFKALTRPVVDIDRHGSLGRQELLDIPWGFISRPVAVRPYLIARLSATGLSPDVVPRAAPFL